jgi:two-component system, cell cycle response regulator
MSSQGARSKTVVTVISKIAEKPVGKDACLVVIYGLELGRKYNLENANIIIGRSSKSDVQIDQESVSRNHAKIINTGKSIILRDLGSTNGTYVNDQLIDEYVMRDGDFIKIGRTIFKFLSGGNIENAYHEEIYRLTTVDGLTQVFNRRYFLEQLDREVSRAKRYRRELSLILFDIDRFKGINDSYGHLAGDYVLKQLATVIKGKIRREDILARYGGEEFAIVLEGTDRAGARQLAERIRQEVAQQSFASPKGNFQATLSIGVASYPDDGREKADIIARADQSLYAAKDGGRNRTVCWGEIDRGKLKVAGAAK